LSKGTAEIEILQIGVMCGGTNILRWSGCLGGSGWWRYGGQRVGIWWWRGSGYGGKRCKQIRRSSWCRGQIRGDIFIGTGDWNMGLVTIHGWEWEDETNDRD
jgi:hypothetical protein